MSPRAKHTPGASSEDEIIARSDLSARAGFWSWFWRIGGVVNSVIIAFLLAILIGQTLSSHFNVVYHFTAFSEVTQFDYQIGDKQSGTLQLPATISNLEPDEKVVLTAKIEAGELDSLLLKVINTPMELYVNDQLYHKVGSPDTYPDFQKEPPTTISVIALPVGSTVQHLRLEYTVSPVRDSMELPMIFVGDKNLLFLHIMESNALSFALAVIALLSGLVLVAMALVVASRVPMAGSIVWLGLCLLSTGAWTVADNDITIFVMPQSSLLYNLKYIGLIGYAIPFIRFGTDMLNPRYRWPLDGLYHLLRILFLAVVILHLLGIVPFAQSAYLMQFLSPVALVIFVVVIITEYFYYKNPIALQFLISSVIFTVFALAEVLNFWFNFFSMHGIFFQIGMLLFIGELAILGWYYVRDAFDGAAKSAKLEGEIAATQHNLELQHSVYENLTQSTNEIRAVRHDLRHQLRAIKGYLQEGDEQAALNYIDTIYGNIPQIADKLICENYAVNALAAHYLARARELAIDCDLRLEVPKVVGDISDNDLCVIIGNLFENAIEASAYVDEKKRFIKLQSSIDRQRFTVVLDNSYDGYFVEKGGDFYSRKRSGKGIGMASVKAVVLKYGGAMKTEATCNVFMTSLYLKI
ncbi:MAG: GHKL domain-containing protein [Coriobacteriales bacterium]|jgi:signal transduction histidine kinase|nr:GHKL domain-containing protein [Coriobacteriales bacterium]